MREALLDMLLPNTVPSESWIQHPPPVSFEEDFLIRLPFLQIDPRLSHIMSTSLIKTSTQLKEMTKAKQKAAIENYRNNGSSQIKHQLMRGFNDAKNSTYYRNLA